ncbi:MAG: hypothetical protein NZV14_01905 [Bryobacteraceae bacterium]|nr:hypothetical protein [Bryobacteraceae bacterium]MDW8376883.1 hypothetical protein [Bryobacterales bacterium]
MKTLAVCCTIWVLPFLVAPLPAEAQLGLRLTLYRQAVAHFYPLESPQVPPALARETFQAKATDGAIWTAARSGIWREDLQAAPLDRRRYFSSRRWLAPGRVLSLAPGPNGSMWVRTETGISHIEFRRMTLAQKASEFEARIEQRHNRHGMVADSVLLTPGDLNSNQTISSDNDGLWTALYGAAECYRFAVTRSAQAQRLAERSVQALLELERITQIPGLPARSYILRNEPRPRDGIWNLTSDGLRLWKADTSSDEIVGHYYLLGLAWDLLKTDSLRQPIADAVRRITDHILQNHLMLVDFHGQPTFWGRWDQEYFHTKRGKPDSPLNALEILSFLKTAAHVTREPRYQNEYLRLARNEGYAQLTARYLELRETVNYSDEELAMLSFYPLLKYETDPALRKVYLEALEQWWQNMVREKNPLWTFIYLSCKPGKPASLADAVWTLQRIPMDLRHWTIENSSRPDVEFESQSDRFGRRQSKTLLPPDERPVMKWNGNPFRLDGGNQGATEDDGAFFLLPYWMGRYYRFLIGE